jgi:hypothetical protein
MRYVPMQIDSVHSRSCSMGSFLVHRVNCKSFWERRSGNAYHAPKKEIAVKVLVICFEKANFLFRNVSIEFDEVDMR